jgi:hypothetical protein
MRDAALTVSCCEVHSIHDTQPDLIGLKKGLIHMIVSHVKDLWKKTFLTCGLFEMLFDIKFYIYKNYTVPLLFHLV